MELMIPAVTVSLRPKGLPMAIASCPTWSSWPTARGAVGETGAVDLDHADVVELVGADDPALQPGAVVEPDLDLVDAVDDVGGGHDVAVLVVDEAGADAGPVADLDHGRQQGLGDGGGGLLPKGWGRRRSGPGRRPGCRRRPARCGRAPG